MGRKKLSALFLKYGVTVGCIAGSTSFINQDGNHVGVGVCCWYFINMPDARPDEIKFGFYNNTVPDVDIENDNDDDDDDDESFGLHQLFSQ